MIFNLMFVIIKCWYLNSHLWILWGCPSSCTTGKVRLQDCTSGSPRIFTMGKAGWAGWDRNHKDMQSLVEEREKSVMWHLLVWCDIYYKIYQRTRWFKINQGREFMSILSVLYVCAGEEGTCMFACPHNW